MSQVTQAERLDQYVVRQMPKLSRSAATHLISEGKISVNGKISAKAGYKVRSSDKIKIDYDPSVPAEIPQIELPIIYEDKNCVVIDKPVGVLSHSKGAFNPEATVATWLKPRLKNLNGERAGIVHRLDRGTSGVMICAKTPKALSWLQKQFSERKVKKTYLTIVEGVPPQKTAVIDMPIERNPKKPQSFRVGANGKSATTAYELIEAGEHHSLLELAPTTGRTHQLRVHLRALKHPIVGDTLYGGPDAERLYLHAGSLEITLPNKVRKTFKSPVPTGFRGLVSK